MTQKELAQKLGITPRHLRRLARAGMPTDSVAAAKVWRAANIEGDDNEDLARLRGDVLRKRAQLLDLEYRERSKQLLPTDEVRMLLVNMGQSLRAHLLRATNTLRAEHPGLAPGVFVTVERVHHEALALLAGDALRIADADDA